MKSQSRVIMLTVAAGLAMPAMAQQSTSMHPYVQYFKYTDQAIKAMTENPQDRAAQAAKLTESFGGRMEAIYWLPAGGEFDGFVIGQFPNEASINALTLALRSTGSFTRTLTLPLMTSGDFKAAMEKAKSTTSAYTPPTATRQ